MPGRFSITKENKVIEKRFGAKVPEGFKKRFNVSPSQEVLVILNSDQKNFVFARWGWNPKFVGHPVINARSENLDSNKLFGKAFRERRCIIVMDGYYEWEETPDGKKPYRIILKDESLFGVAGVWIEEHGEYHVATITTEPNELIGKIHERMPAILKRSDETKWLNQPDFSMLKPYSAKEMSFYRVSEEVNSSRHDKETMVQSLSEEEQAREHKQTQKNNDTQTTLNTVVSNSQDKKINS